MLPSMPILFTRDSQDAFGNKIEPSTSHFLKNDDPKTATNHELISQKVEESVKVTPEEKITTNLTGEPQKTPAKLDESVIEAEALAKSYLKKIKSRFSSNLKAPTNKFVQFRTLLKSFDPAKETPVDLYNKIEELFGNEDKDIVDEFLLFLKPGQASEIGRFMDHFMYVQMTSFLDLLHSTLARKPTVLRKVLRAITRTINTGSSDTLKTRVLVHLRSHPRLAEMFKSLFPDERPPDSVYNTNTDNLNESFITNDVGYDILEFDDEKDDKWKLEAKESLDTVYLNGRVFLQHGRLLRAACVTYPYSKEPYRVHAKRLAPIHFHLSPPDSDEDGSSPKRRRRKSTVKLPSKRNRKQLKSPIKNVKDVNDNTKHKDCTTKINVTNSPKNMKSKTQNNTKTKNTREKKELESKPDIGSKREKKDKNQVTDKIEKKDERSKAKITKISHLNSVETNKAELKSNTWTRDEDKTMLQILKGEADSEQVFGRIRELLPHRSTAEIKERFCQVMSLLQQMSVREVT